MFLKIFLQEIIRWNEQEKCGRTWTKSDYDAIFEPIRVRVSGSHDSYTRRVLIDDIDDVECSPGEIVLPAVRLDLGQLQTKTYINLLG